MKYYLFLDESGDHGLANVDYHFPVFVLCGVIFSEQSYADVKSEINTIKQKYWQGKKVIFHSRDIRKCEKEFKTLFDLDIKRRFYHDIDILLSQADYTIIASAIQKQRYIKRYGRLHDDVYEIALSFIIERAVFYLDEVSAEQADLEIIIEKRGKKEDRKLETHFNHLRSRGTYYVTPERIKKYSMKISFHDKGDNINGLQIADLLAYPIARYVIDEKRANPAFDVLSPKFYSKNNKRYGLKLFP